MVSQEEGVSLFASKGMNDQEAVRVGGDGKGGDFGEEDLGVEDKAGLEEVNRPVGKHEDPRGQFVVGFVHLVHGASGNDSL